MKSYADKAIEVRGMLGKSRKVFVWAGADNQTNMMALNNKDASRIDRCFPGYIGIYDWMASQIEIERDITNFYIKRSQELKCM